MARPLSLRLPDPNGRGCCPPAAAVSTAGTRPAGGREPAAQPSSSLVLPKQDSARKGLLCGFPNLPFHLSE